MKPAHRRPMQPAWRIAPTLRVRSMAPTLSFGRYGADRRARQKPLLAPIVEREHAAAPGHDIDDEIGVFPDLVLRPADIEGRAADLAELHIAVADDEFALRIAHWRRAVAAAARLVKEHRSVVGDDLADELDGRWGR